jgi:hypothetical protein
MILESIRELNNAVPFQPYEIRMASGARHRVPHPDFVLIAPRGNYVIVADEDNRPHHLSTLLIEAASVAAGHGRRARKSAA